MTTSTRTAHGMRTFTALWFGQLISTLGSGLTGFALGVWIYEQTGSETLFAVSIFIYFLPTVLFAPVAGVIADRYDRRLVMILSDSVAGLSTLFIGLMVFTGKLAIWQIYLSSIFLSAAGALQWPTYAAVTSLIVPREHLGRAGGMNQIGDALSSLISPAIAGALYVSTGGLRTIILIDLLTYLFALCTLLVVRFPRSEKSGEEKSESFWEAATYGWRYIRARPGLFRLLIVFAGLNFAVNLTFPLFTPLLLNLSSPDWAGYISSIIGAGIFVGALVMSIWGGPKKRIRGIYIFETMTGLCLALTGLSSRLAAITAAQFMMVIFMPITNGCSQAIWQSKVAPDVQGRVFSARRMLAFSIIPIAYLMGGPLAENVFEPLMSEGGALAASIGPVIGVGPGRGIGLLFMLAGLTYILIAQSIILHPRIWRIEKELPDAISVEDTTGLIESPA